MTRFFVSVICLLFSQVLLAQTLEAPAMSEACSQLQEVGECENLNENVRSIFELLSANCKQSLQTQKCSEVQDQEKVRTCESVDICEDREWFSGVGRAISSCTDGLKDFAVDTLSGIWDVTNGISEAMFEAMFCGNRDCLFDEAETAARDQALAAEIASKYALEADYCESNTCTHPEISCLDIDRACNGDFRDLRSCNPQLQHMLESVGSTRPSPAPSLNATLRQEEDPFIVNPDLQRAESLFARRRAECYAVRAEWSRNQPEIIENIKKVLTDLYQIKKQEWMCYKPGHQAQLFCRLLAEVGLLELGAVKLVRFIINGIKAGKSTRALAEEIAGNNQIPVDDIVGGTSEEPLVRTFLSADGVSAPATGDVIPADFDDIWMQPLEEPPPATLNDLTSNGENFSNLNLQTLDVSSLSDADVLQIFGRSRFPTTPAEIQLLRGQLTSRVESLRSAELYARNNGWNQGAGDSRVLLSEDFWTPASTDTGFWATPRDRVTPESVLRENPAFAYRRGWFTVFAHGTPGIFSVNNRATTVRQLAEGIKAQGHRNEPINLMSCHAGVCSGLGPSAAQELANLLRVPVVAANGIVETTFDSAQIIQRNSSTYESVLEGSWRTFLPQN